MPNNSESKKKGTFVYYEFHSEDSLKLGNTFGENTSVTNTLQHSVTTLFTLNTGRWWWRGRRQHMDEGDNEVKQKRAIYEKGRREKQVEHVAE